MGGLPQSTLKVLLGGQEQDVISRLVPPGSALVIENMFWDHQGNLVKRAGSAALGTNTIPGGATPPRAWALGKHQGSLVRLGRQGQAPIMTWDPDHSAWLAPTSGSITSQPQSASWLRGPMVATVQHAAQQSTVGNSFQKHDVAVGAGFQCVVFEEWAGGPQFRIHEILIDLTTGKTVSDFTWPMAGHTLYPHVAIVGGRYACFAYNSNGTLRVDVYDLQASDPSSPVGVIAATTEPVPDTPIEIMPLANGTDLVVGYQGQSGQFRACTVRPSTLSVVSTVNLKTQTSGPIASNRAFCWAQNLDGVTWSSGYPALVTCDDGTGVVEHVGWVQIDASNYGAGRTSTVDGTATAFNIAAGTSGAGSDTSVPLDVLYHEGGAVPVVKHAAVSASGTPTIDTNAINVFLASRLFRDAGGKSCYLVGTPWAAQATYYVMPIRDVLGSSQFPAPLCRTEVQSAYTATFAGHLPTPSVADANTVYVSVSAAVVVTTLETDANVDLVKIQFRNGIEPTLPAPNLGNPVEAIESMFVPGGQLCAWDGKYYGLAGFAYGPNTPSVGAGSGSGLTADNTYTYAAVYSYTDAQGRKWRSAPSPTVQHTTGSAPAAISVSVNYLQLLDRPGINVEVYRDTQLEPGVLRRLPVVFPNLHDVPSTPNLTFTDQTSDAELETSETIYTTDGILPNAITPGALAVVVFQGRLWFVSADDPQALWFSDLLTPPGTGGFLAGAGAFFNSDLIVDVRDDRGPITGLGVCDGRMVVFKHDAIYTIEGTGPDATGVGATYVAQRISGSVGLDNPRSIVDAFDGVWFQSSSSRAPFWRLDRGTSLQYVGAGVRDFGSLPVVGGVSLPEQSQVRWYTFDNNGGHVLVYDVITQLWSTFTSPFWATSADCAVDWNGVAVWSSAAPNTLGQVLVETPGTYTDAGNAFGQRSVFPWLQLADLNGYQRVYLYQGIGQTVDDHLLRVNLYRDLLDSDIAFSCVDYDMLFDAQPRWDWELRFPMKLSAVKVEIISEPTKADLVTPTAGFALSGLSIVYGVKAGLKPTVYTHRLVHS